MQTDPELNTDMSFEDFKTEVLNDYKIAVTSRECSLLGRREVLTGKAKFGIFGDGKEIPQLAWAKAFKAGDWRSGYYRDQTFMMAIGALTIQQFFAGLYGHTDIHADPMSGGRQMGGHFATPTINQDGSWKNLSELKNSSADISPTAGQMPRLLGLAQASKIYRQVDGLEHLSHLSSKGNEVAWGTIGNASTSEGLFFETINAAGVLQVPMVMSVWDDEYGISVHAKHQTTKESISEILKGFHPHFQTYKLKNRLLKEGLIKNICAICDLSTWNNKQINLELDHIDGNREHNVATNIQTLCKNCHSYKGHLSNDFKKNKQQSRTDGHTNDVERIEFFNVFLIV